MSAELLSAFIIGIVGSGHCISMCGGITTMLTSAIQKPSPHGDITHVTIANNLPRVTASRPASNDTNVLLLTYHLGRVFSYCIIGAIAGFTGSLAAKSLGLPIAGLRIVAAIFLILLGLYIGQWLMWLNRIEAVGKHLWKYVSPLAKYVIPVNTPKKALGLGALWGWLPCGLVYSTLTWSLASGSLYTGAAIMFFFGLGTLPALMAISLGINKARHLLSSSKFRKAMALSLIIYGIYSLFIAWQLLFT